MTRKRATKTAKKVVKKKTTRAKGPQARRRAATRGTRPPQPRPPGEDERIAVRREAAMQARVSGANMRQIAAELGVSVGTVHEDINAEIRALRDSTRSLTEDYRDMELMRMDCVLRGLLPGIQAGDSPAARAAIAISIQRSRLLGLYKGETDTADDQAQDFLVFLEEFWRRRRLGELGEGVPIIDIVPKGETASTGGQPPLARRGVRCASP